MLYQIQYKIEYTQLSLYLNEIESIIQASVMKLKILKPL